MNKSLFREDIQGLRGIAVVSVVLYHAWPKLLPGGFVGVDIFFVISGFVITNSILKDFSLGRFSIAQFYRRRVRRIFPALYTVIAFVLAVSWFIMPPHQLMEVAQTALATVLFCSNIVFKNLSGYFENAVNLKPLLHTWSLSVEEQFYVLYPIFAFLIHRYFPRLLRPTLIILMCASLALAMVMLAKHHSTATFFLAPPRAFELLMGAIIACPGSRTNLSRPLREGLSLAALAMMVAPLFLYSQQTVFPGLAAALPCLGAAVIIQVGTGEQASSYVGRLFSTKPFTFFGNLSYSFYLWHWPILALARQRFGTQLGNAALGICVITALLASVISLYWIEKPFLDKRRESLPYLRIGVGLIAVASLLLFGIVAFKGVPERFTPAALAFFSTSGDYNLRRVHCQSGDGLPIPYNQNCSFGANGVAPDTAVWGDSHGAELSQAIGEQLAPQRRSLLAITASSCPPILNFNLFDRPYCARHNAETLSGLISDSRIHTVILAMYFTWYQDAKMDDLLQNYRQLVEKLRASGKRVIVIYPVPTYDFDPPTVLGMRTQSRLTIADVGGSRQAFESTNRKVITLLDSLYTSGAVERVIPEDQLCDTKLCRVYQQDIGTLYFNPTHLSLNGARLVSSKLQL